ncbi:DUF6624 domain-containing protein [Robertkochia aurantiaca]|uniref:DUF6624 domain-containing protein n=1 Tax=Robertkochia aurantiaca TaxID=2873700 RepID=UPI001CCA8F45|nr:DUF6624 domain-containing protein [Robertkochia sp. 3YJGBD-33]
MTLRTTLTLFGILIVAISFAQDQEKYTKYVKKADSLYDAGVYDDSAEAYETAFQALEGRAYTNHRYNAACSHALSGDTERSFFHLFRLADNPHVKYKNLRHITTDSDLTALHDDERWEKLIATVKANKDEYEKDLDKPLVAKLDTILASDQGSRRKLREMEKEYGRESEEYLKQYRTTWVTDSLNVIEVTKILDERGWLGPDVIGKNGSNALFLVIQHADLETQKKYLPMLREAVELGNAQGGMLALLQDRVAMKSGEKQVYGSQIARDESGEFYVSPLLEPEKVNERRAAVGLGPIEEYVSRWNINWDVEKHKERTRALESEEKEN